MKEVGIDLSNVTPTKLTARMQSEAHFLVTLGCGERCPLVPEVRRVDWPLDDPESVPIGRVREIRDDIERRVAALLAKRGWRS